MPDPLAYFLTWTTHGTWLHGDERLSIDRFHNSRQHPPLQPNPPLLAAMHASLRDPPCTLDAASRAIVEEVIRAHCTFRRWELRAINVRSNHVHVVVRCPGRTSPESAMSQFKAWATRRLRESGVIALEQKVWTEHGSTRWINDEAGLDAAIRYVLYEQD